MKDIALDLATGDIVVSAYDLALASGVDQIAQSVLMRLRFFQGEWFADLSAGVPYYQEILGRPNSQGRVESLLRDAILSTPGVEEIVSFEADYDGTTRTFSLDFTVRADDGQTIRVSEVL